MQRTEYTSANRKAWNEAAPASNRQQLSQAAVEFHQPGHNCLSAAITQILKQIGLEGKTVAHLCCNNGRELLSIRNLGAARCIGFDISDKFVEQARQLARRSGVACDFVRADVYEIPATYNGTFDLVYLSVGTLGWMPDIRAFFQAVARLLRPGGWMVVHEIHPILDMFESDDVNDPPVLQHSYFRTQPYIEDAGVDYSGTTAYQTAQSYWFHHKMSDVIDGCLANGLTLQSFQEYDSDISNIFSRFMQQSIRLPLSYTLITRKASDSSSQVGW